MASRIPNPFVKPVEAAGPVVPHGLVPAAQAMAEKFRKQTKRKAAPNRSK